MANFMDLISSRPQGSVFKQKHLLNTASLEAEEILFLLELADCFWGASAQEIKQAGLLRGKTVINFFMEASTRTRTSFEIAGKRLSADVINVSASGSSITKGETLLDTARTLDAMNPDVIVIRHSASGAAQMISGAVQAAVVNAGDGMHEHPTQALLDCATIRRLKGKGPNKTLEDLNVAIIGDIAHSRVARSNIHTLKKMGANIRVAGPLTLLPREISALGVSVFSRIEEALVDADVVIVLRIQRERQDQSLIPNLREYSRYFGLNLKRLALAKPDCLVLHPGPVNIGVEIEPSVLKDPRAAVQDQVTMGVAVRMGILYTLANQKHRF